MILACGVFDAPAEPAPDVTWLAAGCAARGVAVHAGAGTRKGPDLLTLQSACSIRSLLRSLRSRQLMSGHAMPQYDCE